MTLITTLILLLALVVAGYLFLTWFTHRAYRAPRLVERGSPADYDLPFEEQRLSTANGKQIHTWYIPIDKTPCPAVAIIHGWGGNAELMLPFAKLLHRSGYAVLLIDARNHGRSDEDSFSSLPRFAEDLESGLDWLSARPEIDSGRIAVMGHSVGAGAVLLAASRRPEVAAAISLSAFTHPVAMMRSQMRAHRIPYLPIGWLVLRYIERTIGFDFDAIAPITTISRIEAPVLLVHGEADRLIPTSAAVALYQAPGGGTRELYLVPGADHDSVERLEEHGCELVDFLNRHL